MTAGLILSGKIWEFTDHRDIVGGNMPSGTVIYEGIQARLQNSSNSLLMNIQGYETSRFFSAIFYPRPGMNLTEKKHYFQPINPPNYRFANCFFRIISIQESSLHPSDPRRQILANLEREDLPHSESYQ